MDIIAKNPLARPRRFQEYDLVIYYSEEDEVATIRGCYQTEPGKFYERSNRLSNLIGETNRLKKNMYRLANSLYMFASMDKAKGLKYKVLLYYPYKKKVVMKRLAPQLEKLVNDTCVVERRSYLRSAKE